MKSVIRESGYDRAPDPGEPSCERFTYVGKWTFTFVDDVPAAFDHSGRECGRVARWWYVDDDGGSELLCGLHARTVGLCRGDVILDSIDRSIIGRRL